MVICSVRARRRALILDDELAVSLHLKGIGILLIHRALPCGEDGNDIIGDTAGHGVGQIALIESLGRVISDPLQFSVILIDAAADGSLCRIHRIPAQMLF